MVTSKTRDIPLREFRVAQQEWRSSRRQSLESVAVIPQALSLDDHHLGSPDMRLPTTWEDWSTARCIRSSPASGGRHLRPACGGVSWMIRCPGRQGREHAAYGGERWQGSHRFQAVDVAN